MSERSAARARTRVTRDFLIALIAGGLLTYEVLIGGGRPAVLTACTSLLLSPLVMRVDEARRKADGDE